MIGVYKAGSGSFLNNNRSPETDQEEGIPSCSSSPLPKCESPSAKQIWGMGIRWGKETLHLDSFVDLPGKTGEFVPVHLLAHVFLKAMFQTGRLDRTVGNRDH